MNQKMMRVIVLACGVAIGGALAPRLDAQPVAFKATDLLRHDVVDMEGVEVLVMLVDFAPGGTTGKHTHPGHEIAYVLEGSGVSEIEGEASVVRKAGTVTYIPPKKLHESKNVSTTDPMKLIVFRIHPKGKPVIDSRVTEPSITK